MGRKKKEIAPASPVMVGVGRGCVDCEYYSQPVQKNPCKNCESWSGWTPSQAYKDRVAHNAAIAEFIMNKRKKRK